MLFEILPHGVTRISPRRHSGTENKENYSQSSSVALCLRGKSVFGYNALVMIAKDLREDLVCPACIQPLEYRENPESLKCKQCHRVYAVKDDIPIMLVDEATIEG